MTNLRCFVCDIDIQIKGDAILPKGELPPEIKTHIETAVHLNKKHIQTLASQVMRAIIEVTPELDSPSVLQMWKPE